MQSPSTAQKVLAVILGVCLLVLSGGMAWAAANDFVARTRVAEGVTLAGRDISGLTADEVRALVSGEVSDSLTRPLTVVADGRELTLDPTGAIAVDADAMVDAAFQPRRNTAFMARLRHDILQEQLEADIKPIYTVNQSALDDWVTDVADKVDRKAVSAKAVVEGSDIKITPSKTGRKVETAEASNVLKAVLVADDGTSDDSRRVSIPVDVLEPKKTESDIGTNIVVDRSQRRIRLFDGDRLVKTYPCAVGTAAYPTPLGDWKVVLKRYRPTWVNPGSDWAKDMPPSIPPGPGNPLGTRAINLSAPGIRFHGTENIRSVGTAASHGCMRMYRRDIEDLFDRVKVGDKVFIVQ